MNPLAEMWRDQLAEVVRRMQEFEAQRNAVNREIGTLRKQRDELLAKLAGKTDTETNMTLPMWEGNTG